MSKYMLIESRDPFESNDVTFSYELSESLARAGHDVTVFLVQNGVLPARKGAKAERLQALVRAGIRVLADEVSLQARGMPRARLLAGIEPAPLDVVLDHLAAGHKTLWH